MTELKRTPLFALHQKLGARMVPFAGFEMPVQYRGVIDEHLAVRERAGLFDVSHMGQIHFAGAEACTALEWLVTCPIDSLKVGQVRYGLLCNTDGGCVDDVTVHRLSECEYFLCVNASNIEKDLAWITANAPRSANLTIDDRSAKTGLIALQGPAAQSILAPLASIDLASIKRFYFATGKIGGIEALLARTGYTGSPGYEIYVAADDAARLFELLLDAGQSAGIEPAGLGARDTLRLEAALPLYGHELDDTTSPLEAGLDRFVKLEQGQFLGADAIVHKRNAGLSRKLVGFELLERGIARAEYPITHQGKTVGVVTSGTHSPSLGKAIGLAYVPPALSPLGSEFEVWVRNRGLRAQVVATPFVSGTSAKTAANPSGKAVGKP